MEENENWIPWQQELENQAWFNYDHGLLQDDPLYQMAHPGRVQFTEWSQQMMATMYQNWYNSAPEAMKRATQAGINPFVAASGIVGNSNQVASPPPSTPASRVPDMLSSAASMLGSTGGAFGNVASSIATLAKLRSEINNLDQNTASEFEKMGFTKLQSKALSVQLKYLDSREQIGVWQALADFDKTKQEYRNLYAQHANILKQYDEILANIELIRQQEGELKAREQYEYAMKGKIEEETRFIKADNDFFELHHYRLGTPVYDSLRDMMVSDGTFNLEEYGNLVGGYESKVSGLVEDARLSAQENHVFAIESSRQKGKNLADEIYGRIGSPADFAGRIAKMGTDLIKGVVDKSSNLFKSGKASDIRKELRMMLDNAYDAAEKYPEDAAHYNKVINEIQAALMLNNKELLDWWKKSNQ